MYTYETADVLQYDEVEKLYKNYSNMYLSDLYGKFSFGREIVVKAEGEFLYTNENKKIFDMTGGLGVANMGHNHPRILKVRAEFLRKKSTEIHKNYLNRFLAAASKNLADILPGDLQYSFFCNSGAESVDGALKLAYKFHSGKRQKVLKSNRSFHGKTIGAGSLSTGDNFVAGNARFSFQKIQGVLTYEFNNAESVIEQIKLNNDDIYAIFVEPYSCSTLTEANKNFLDTIVPYCRDNKILVVYDEIYSGFAKCGPNFYMEKYNHTPDIVCLSKALGGGKASISAYVSTPAVYAEAYGTMAGALMHSTTYNSFGEECVTVIEATNILIDEELSKKSLIIENMLREKLTKLAKKYPDHIREVRGAGTHFGIILNTKYETLQPLMQFIPVTLVQDPLFMRKLITTAFMEKYYQNFNVVTAFTSNLEVIWNFSPSPISCIDEINCCMESLDKLFESSQTRVITDFVTKNFTRLF
jgi:putrescine aminotransferase